MVQFHYWSSFFAIGIAQILIYLIFFRKKKKITLANKRVIIIGASSGIGEACAKELYKVGCNLILCSRRINELERVKSELLKIKDTNPIREWGEIEIIKLDITNQEETIKTLRGCQGVDILINNAGISYRGKIKETEMEVVRKVMETNFFGQVVVTKALLPQMLERKEGHILFISSLQGRISIPFRSAYSCSKHALQAFADCLRSEVNEEGVKVTVVSPGYVNTHLSVHALNPDGSAYNKRDKTQEKGLEASKVASMVREALQKQEKEVIISRLFHRLAIYIRIVYPSLYFKIMNRRALKREGLS